MKFFKKILGEEWAELQKFNQLNQDERSIVFYAEDSSSFVHFEQIIYELTEKMECQICYVTSAKEDPILSNQNKRIRAFYIGLGTARITFFLELKAKILVMTMPDLGNSFIQKSAYPVHYMYIQHSMVSTHMIYPKKAFEHFDTICCVGPHHMNEIREMEKVYQLPVKILFEHGYGKLDSIIQKKTQLFLGKILLQVR